MFRHSLIAEMDAPGVGRAELARRISRSRAWVSRVLAGARNLTMASTGKLAFALGMKVIMTLEPVDPAAKRPEGGLPAGQRRGA